MRKHDTGGGGRPAASDRAALWVALGAIASGAALFGWVVHRRLAGIEETLAAAAFLLAISGVTWAWWRADAARREAIAVRERVASEAELERATERLRSAPASARRGRVLVIDHEPGVGKLIQRVLRRDDDVVATTSGREALRAIQSEADFDAVLCDVVMPEITGMELYRMLRAELPGLAERMVFVNGGASSEAREFLSAVPNPRIAKPLDARALRAAVASLIARGGAASA